MTVTVKCVTCGRDIEAHLVCGVPRRLFCDECKHKRKMEKNRESRLRAKAVAEVFGERRVRRTDIAPDTAPSTCRVDPRAGLRVEIRGRCPWGGFANNIGGVR